MVPLLQNMGVAGGVAATVTSGGVNAKGAWVSLGLATLDAMWFDLLVRSPNSTPRHFVDIGIGPSGSQVIIVENLYLFPGATSGHRLRVPVAVPAGAEVWIRTQASTGAAAASVAIVLYGQRAEYPLGLSSMAAISPDLAATMAGNIAVPLTYTWTEIVAAAPRAFRWLAASVGYSGTVPATSQVGVVEIGVGPAGSETLLMTSLQHIAASFATTSPGWFSVPAWIEAGARISARISAPTPGSDTLAVGIMGGY